MAAANATTHAARIPAIRPSPTPLTNTPAMVTTIPVVRARITVVLTRIGGLIS